MLACINTIGINITASERKVLTFIIIKTNLSQDINFSGCTEYFAFLSDPVEIKEDSITENVVLKLYVAQ